MTNNKYLSLIIILLITFLASFIGGYTTASFKEPWYSEIILPSFNPPSWVFAPVWTTLYVLMSIAAWRVWINFYNSKILSIYFYHLVFNASWSIVFFGFHLIKLALINLVLILIFILILMKIYFEKDKIINVSEPATIGNKIKSLETLANIAIKGLAAAGGCVILKKAIKATAKPTAKPNERGETGKILFIKIPTQIDSK